MSEPQAAAGTRHFFKNARGQKLAATFVDAGGGCDDVAILCHGYQACRDSSHYPQLAQALVKLPLSSLRFDFSGNGESEVGCQGGGWS